MGQRAVSDGEIIQRAWEAEDRRRAGAPQLAGRKLGRGRGLYLMRYTLRERWAWALIVSGARPYMGRWLMSDEDIYEFSDGDAAWRAAIGWDGKGEPEGFARHRRRT